MNKEDKYKLIEFVLDEMEDQGIELSELTANQFRAGRKLIKRIDGRTSGLYSMTRSINSSPNKMRAIERASELNPGIENKLVKLLGGKKKSKKITKKAFKTADAKYGKRPNFDNYHSPVPDKTIKHERARFKYVRNLDAANQRKRMRNRVLKKLTRDNN